MIDKVQTKIHQTFFDFKKFPILLRMIFLRRGSRCKAGSPYLQEFAIVRLQICMHCANALRLDTAPPTLTSVARSRQAFTATSAQNHGHFGTFHGHIPYMYIFHVF
jgi:hypothetical protein